eukprot:scaffold79607_cov26-Tisochrysis_lutea.AAC.2
MASGSSEADTTCWLGPSSMSSLSAGSEKSVRSMSSSARITTIHAVRAEGVRSASDHQVLSACDAARTLRLRRP